jgi:hypothetical protein
MDYTDNIAYYKCDVSKWEEVEAVSKKIVEEVHSRPRSSKFGAFLTGVRLGILQFSSTTQALLKAN